MMRRKLALAVLLFAMMCSNAPAFGKLPIDLLIEYQEGEPRGTLILSVVIHVRNIPMAEDVVLEVYDTNTIVAKEKIGNLERGQTWGKVLQLKKPKDISYAVVRYRVQNRLNTIAQFLLDGSNDHKFSWLTWLPVGNSLLGVFIGAWLVNLYTSRRERSRAKFEWAKLVFEKYEKGYREFLNNWGESPNIAVLEPEFEQLKRASPVTEEIRLAYRQAMNALVREDYSDEDKHSACRRLRISVEQRLRDPW